MTPVSEDELEAIRQRKLAALREQALQQQAAEQRAAELEAQKEAVLRQILTPEARARLVNIKMVRPQFAEQIELQLIQLATSGRLRAKLTDQQLKALLQQIQQREREPKITFR